MKKIDINLYELAGGYDDVHSNLSNLSSGLNNSGFKEFMSLLGSSLGLTGDCNYAVQCLEAAAAILNRSSGYIKSVNKTYFDVKAAFGGLGVGGLAVAAVVGNISFDDAKAAKKNIRAARKPCYIANAYDSTAYAYNIRRKYYLTTMYKSRAVFKVKDSTRIDRKIKQLLDSDARNAAMNDNNSKIKSAKATKTTLNREYGEWQKFVRASDELQQQLQHGVIPKELPPELQGRTIIKEYIQELQNNKLQGTTFGKIETTGKVTEAVGKTVQKVGVIEGVFGVGGPVDKASDAIIGVFKSAGKAAEFAKSAGPAAGKVVGTVAVAYPVAKGLTSEIVIKGDVVAAVDNFKTEYNNLNGDAAIIGAFARVGDSNCSILERIDNICGAIVEPIMQPLKLLDTLIEGTAVVAGAIVTAPFVETGKAAVFCDLASLKRKLRY